MNTGHGDHEEHDARDHDHHDEITTLVHRGDIDGLVRLIDTLTTAREFTALRQLREQARAAISTGRQLWPVATLAEYRIALRAPAAQAVGVIDDLAGRFTIGPLSEVIAQEHTWNDLAPLLAAEPMACSIAHERAIRGETIEPASLRAFPPVLDIPAVIQPWEPVYAVATYRDDGAEFPAPALPRVDMALDCIAGAEQLDDDVDQAVHQLLEAWTASSNGHAEVVCVQGDAAEALGALGLRRARLAPISGTEALALLAWAGASGGAHGRRRGAAIGRYGAWWVLGALADVLDDWPVPPAQLGATLTDLDWWWWDAAEPLTGWNLNLVVADRHDGIAWAIHASDAR